jgi:NADH:ubiquinone reductase (H+-translocating)
MPDRLAALGNGHVILADRAPWIGSDMGQEARNVIEGALTSLQVEARAGNTLLSVDSEGALLATGEQIDAATIVWCGGMRAPPLQTINCQRIYPACTGDRRAILEAAAPIIQVPPAMTH